MWLSLEAPIVTTYKTPETTFRIECPSSSLTYSNSIIAFIDDNNTSFIFPPFSSLQLMVDSNNRNINKWATLLETTGGKISINKCSTQHIQWEWQKSRLQLKDMLDPESQAIIKQSSVPVKSTDLTQKYLGIHTNTMGNFQDEYNIQ